MTNTKRCPFCGVGTRVPGETTMTLTRGGTTIVVHHVPADVCPSCGEALLTGVVVDELEAIIAAAIAAGVRCEVRDYVAKVA